MNALSNSLCNMPPASGRQIPEAAVVRLPLYLRILNDLIADNCTQISSEQLAALSGQNAAKVRKDLSYLGSYGTRGVGYDVSYLLYQIKRELGLNKAWPVVIVGAGNLGQALGNYGGLSNRGFVVAAVVDTDSSKVGSVVGGVKVAHVDELPQIVQSKSVSIGIIAVPAQHAQSAADLLIRAGVGSILNFAPVILNLPPEINVRIVDMALELQILSFYEQCRIDALEVAVVSAPESVIA